MMDDKNEDRTVVLIADALGLDLTLVKNFSVYCDGVAHYPIVKVEYHAHRKQSDIKNKSVFMKQPQD